MQAGADVCEPGVATPPTIVSANGTVICGSNGAVYLTINHAITPTKEYIWTLNDAEITEARGKKYHIATQAGVYRVYIGGVGCDDNASARLTVSMNTAGDIKPVGSVYATNNGVICGTSNTVLTALNMPSSGTLTWYKNGIAEPSKTGNSISLGTTDVGDWFAVMSDGATCVSKASNVVSVQAEPASTPLPLPDVYVNNNPVDVATFCKNGYLSLKLNNKAAYDALGIGITVQWYNGNNLLGAGDELTTVAPTGDEFLLHCVVSDNTGANCAAEAIKSKAMTAVAPSRPGVLGSPALICGSRVANLTASGGQAGYTYQWYKAGSAIIGETAVNYSTDQPGFYAVQMATAGGCLSPMSASTEIKTSDVSLLQFTNPVILAEPNSTHTYQVTGSHSPTEYIWSITGDGVLVDAGTTGNTMRVKYNNIVVASTAELTVTAKNACGNSQPLTQVIDIVPACTQVSNIAPSMSQQGDVPLGATITMSATATGSDPFTYQWFKDGTAITTPKATPMHTISGVTAANNGEYSVKLKNDCTPLGVEKIAGSLKALDLATTPTGSGTISGENCFDLVLSNFNEDCGLEADRAALQADFTTAKVYTFTNSGTANKNLRFMVEGADGLLTSITPDPTIPAPTVVLTNGGKYTVSLQFDKAKMEAAGLGTNDDTAIKLKVIALYDVGAVTNQASVNITIKDCQCCGSNGNPAKLKVGANIYLIHQYGDDCWMVSNSREGSAFKTSNDRITNKNTGNYYLYDRAQTACPVGWRLPLYTEADALMKIINAAPQPVKWWTLDGVAPEEVVFGGLGYGQGTPSYWSWKRGSEDGGRFAIDRAGLAPTVNFYYIQALPSGLYRHPGFGVDRPVSFVRCIKKE